MKPTMPIKAEDQPVLSVVIPTFRCAGCIRVLSQKLLETLQEMGLSFEIIFVNDGSPENDWHHISEIAKADKRVKGIQLSRNFGQHNAITAGVDNANGDWLVVMDCDLQHKPEDIPRLYKKALDDNLDIVFGRKKQRADSLFKKIASRLFVFFFSYLSEVQFDRNMTHFSIASRKAIDGLKQLREQGRSYGLSLLWCGYHVGWIDIEHAKRHSGSSSYSFYKALSFAIENVTSYSHKPLRLSIKAGFLMAAFSFLYACWMIVLYFAFNTPPTGWTSLIVSIYFVSGLILANLGIIGLYLGKVFDESKKRPLYLVMNTINIGTK